MSISSNRQPRGCQRDRCYNNRVGSLNSSQQSEAFESETKRFRQRAAQYNQMSIRNGRLHTNTGMSPEGIIGERMKIPMKSDLYRSQNHGASSAASTQTIEKEITSKGTARQATKKESQKGSFVRQAISKLMKRNKPTPGKNAMLSS